MYQEIIYELWRNSNGSIIQNETILQIMDDTFRIEQKEMPTMLRATLCFIIDFYENLFTQKTSQEAMVKGISMEKFQHGLALYCQRLSMWITEVKKLCIEAVGEEEWVACHWLQMENKDFEMRDYERLLVRLLVRLLGQHALDESEGILLDGERARVAMFRLIWRKQGLTGAQISSRLSTYLQSLIEYEEKTTRVYEALLKHFKKCMFFLLSTPPRTAFETLRENVFFFSL